MITTKENTFSGFWPMTKENTFYGLECKNGTYSWYKSKATVLKHLKGTNKSIYRGTLVNGKMFINRHYLTMSVWK